MLSPKFKSLKWPVILAVVGFILGLIIKPDVSPNTPDKDYLEIGIIVFLSFTGFLIVGALIKRALYRMATAAFGQKPRPFKTGWLAFRHCGHLFIAIGVGLTMQSFWDHQLSIWEGTVMIGGGVGLRLGSSAAIRITAIKAT